MGGGGTTGELTLEDVRKQSEITAKDVIRQLEESANHGFMTYPELIRILKFYLKKSMDEMKIFRPDNLPFSLKEVGLKKLYQVLEGIEKKEQKEVRGERQ